MNTEDEYIVEIHDDGHRFYYKNKKLHRLEGPALISRRDVEEYTKLVDEDLYKKVVKPTVREEGVYARSDDGIITYESPIEYVYETAYYLEGEYYSKKEFDAVILKQNMEKELAQTEKPEQKRPKL